MQFNYTNWQDKTIEMSIGEEEELIREESIHEIEQWFPTFSCHAPPKHL